MGDVKIVLNKSRNNDYGNFVYSWNMERYAEMKAEFLAKRMQKLMEEKLASILDEMTSI